MLQNLQQRWHCNGFYQQINWLTIQNIAVLVVWQQIGLEAHTTHRHDWKKTKKKSSSGQKSESGSLGSRLLTLVLHFREKKQTERKKEEEKKEGTEEGGSLEYKALMNHVCADALLITLIRRSVATTNNLRREGLAANTRTSICSESVLFTTLFTHLCFCGGGSDVFRGVR